MLFELAFEACGRCVGDGCLRVILACVLHEEEETYRHQGVHRS